MRNASPVLDRCAGLVFGFHVHGQTAHPVGDESLGHACAAPHDWLWLHLALSDHRARRFIETLEAAPPEARILLLSGEDRIQLHLTDTGAFGILPDIERDFADYSLGSGRFAFWLDGRRLVTARRHPLRAAEHLRGEVEQGRVPQSPAAALAGLPEHFAALVEARLLALAAELARIEDEVLADSYEKDGRFTANRALGALRRELSRYAREFSGLHSAIHRTMSARHGGMSGSPLLEHLPLLMQDVEDFDRDAGGLADRARLIYEEIETRIAATTNRSLAALTVASTLLLPPTFVAGLFGMNVGGIPWAAEKEGFWIVIAFCAGLIVFSYAVLRRLKILP
jgi:zinc transporter